jgi:hypothetical protein
MKTENNNAGKLRVKWTPEIVQDMISLSPKLRIMKVKEWLVFKNASAYARLLPPAGFLGPDIDPVEPDPNLPMGLLFYMEPVYGQGEVKMVTKSKMVNIDPATRRP